jgi:hypothetical protein
MSAVEERREERSVEGRNFTLWIEEQGCIYLVAGSPKDHIATMRTYHSGSAHVRQER